MDLRAGVRGRPNATCAVALRALFLAALTLTTLAYGSAARWQADVAAVAFALLSLAALFQPPAAPRLRRLQFAALALAAALGGLAMLQAVPLPLGSPWVHPAWRELATLAPIARGYVSVAPGSTLEALPSLLAPFLAFATALALFPDDAGARALFRALAGFGALCAVFAFLQETVFPQRLLWEAKTHYLGSLTGSFVNRNTAGTFFGVALTLNLALWLRGRALTRLFACAATALALFLTQSRGAIAASLVAVVLELILFAGPARGGGRRAAGAVALFAVFASRAQDRWAEAAGDARGCAFASTWAAIRDNWTLGTGFGAFQDTFPAYRNADCAGIAGVWERAHNLYLEALLGFGAPVVVVFVVGAAGLAGVFATGLRERRRERFAGGGGAAALILVALHSLVDFSAQIPGFNVYFAAALAAAATLSLRRQEELYSAAAKTSPDSGGEAFAANALRAGKPTGALAAGAKR